MHGQKNRIIYWLASIWRKQQDSSEKKRKTAVQSLKLKAVGDEGLQKGGAILQNRPSEKTEFRTSVDFEIRTLDFEMKVLWIHPSHRPFHLGLGNIEIAQSTIVIRFRLGQ